MIYLLAPVVAALVVLLLALVVLSLRILCKPDPDDRENEHD